MKKELFILRGIPGSGKSTIAESINPKGYNVEADMYFTVDDKYIFDPSMLGEAHKWCNSMVEEWMNEEVSKIVVSNTFTQEWEMAPYFKMAEEKGYVVHSLIVENRHNGTNAHNVPSSSIERMKNRFEVQL
jgi:predicted ABC-type ATPase